MENLVKERMSIIQRNINQGTQEIKPVLTYLKAKINLFSPGSKEHTDLQTNLAEVEEFSKALNNFGADKKEV